MKKMLILIVSAILTAVVLVGCGGSKTQTAGGRAAGEKVSVVFSTGMPDQAWRSALTFFLDTANKKLAEKNIEIKAEYYPSEEEMWKVLPAQIVSGAAPDIIGINNEGVLELIVNGTFAPLDDLIAASKFDVSRLDQANYNGWKYEGNQYALPLTTTISALAVNMTLLKNAGIETAPETMDDLVKAAVAVTNRDKGLYGVCVNLHEFHISQYVHAFGGGWNFGNGLNNENNKAGLQFVVDLFNKHKVAGTPAQMGVNGDTDAFALGKAAMTTGGPWYVAALREKDVDFEWTLVPIPSGTVQKSTLYGWALCMLDSCKNKNAAMEAINAMLSDESYNYLAEVRGDIPAMTKYVPRYEELYPEMAVVLDTASDATAFNYPVAANRFKSDLVTGMESIIFDGRTTVDQLLAEMAADGYKN
jgi:multiple sugar transport system substrate-binding protein